MPMLIATHADIAFLQGIAEMIKAAHPEIVLSLMVEAMPITSTSTLNELAHRVVAAIAPKPSEAMYRRFLRMIALGNGSLEISGGDNICSPRPYSKSLTDRLKRAFPDGSVTQTHLMTKQQLSFEGGGYRGIGYTLTPLGREVWCLLTESNHLAY